MVLVPAMIGVLVVGVIPGIAIIGILLVWSVYNYVNNKRSSVPTQHPGSSQQLLNVQTRLALLKQGELPPLSYSLNNLNLKRNEQLFYSNSCSITQSKTVSRYKAGNRGVSVTPIKGVSFRLGGVKGQMESHLEMVAIGEGVLNVTSSRIIITGIQRPIIMNLDTLVTYDCTDTAIHLASDKASYVLHLASEEGSIVEHVIQRLVADSPSGM